MGEDPDCPRKDCCVLSEVRRSWGRAFSAENRGQTVADVSKDRHLALPGSNRLPLGLEDHVPQLVGRGLDRGEYIE